MKTPQRGTDLRLIDTGLSNAERRQAIEECARLKQRELLGSRHVLHSANAPRRGKYNPLTGAYLGPLEAT